MVSPSAIRAANAQIPTILPDNTIALFIGATSGIGLSTLQQFVAATKDKKPRVFIVGRSATAATPLLAELRQSNSSADISFIEQDISLVRNVDKAVDEVKREVDRLDLLFLSSGFLPFDGRHETSEGLEPSMTTRYYSRLRATQLLTPLLARSSNAHVVNVLAGGQEAAVVESDLDLAQPGNFSVGRANVHVATMLTLSLERLAAENPSISYVHAFPGVTATPLLTRGSSGLLGLLLRYIVSPIVRLLVAYPVADVGAKTLFYATNATFSVAETAGRGTDLPAGVNRASPSAGGVFLVGEKGDVVDNEAVLGGLRKQLAEKVWSHTDEVFGRVVANGAE